MRELSEFMAGWLAGAAGGELDEPAGEVRGGWEAGGGGARLLLLEEEAGVAATKGAEPCERGGRASCWQRARRELAREGGVWGSGRAGC